MKQSAVLNLVQHGRCPLDYGLVKYSGAGKLFKCRSCGARLEADHVMKGRNSLNRVNGQGPFFAI